MLFWILFRYQHFAYHMIFYLLSSKTQFLVYICLNCTCRLWHCDYFYNMYFLNCSYSFLSYLYLLPYSSLFPFPFPSRALFRAHQIVQKEINLTKIAHSLVDQPNFWSIKAIYFYVPMLPLLSAIHILTAGPWRCYTSQMEDLYFIYYQRV